MNEMPKEVKEFLEMIQTATLMALKDEINQTGPFLAQGAILKLYTTNSNTKKVLMTFETQYNDNPRFEQIIRALLDSKVGKAAIIVF